MTVDIRIGDCLEAMADFGAASFDAVICDPPFCSGGVTEAAKGRATHQGLRSETIRGGRFQWFEGDNMTTGGLVFLLRSVAVEALRIVKPSGHLMMFCDWRMVPMLSPAIESAGWRFRNLVVWDKGSFGTGTGFRPAHEMILHMTHRAPEFHSASVGNVIRVPRIHSSKRTHPTEKPVELMRQLVSVCAPRGGLVLDPFCGSGATLKGADAAGVRSIGIERSPDIATAARERINSEAGLFAPAAE